MTQPRVGLITFGDHRSHEWEHVFRAMTEPRHQQALAYFDALPVTLIAAETVARTRAEIDAQADALSAASVEALIAHIPCWTSPNLVVRGVQRLNLPTVLLGNRHPGTHSLVGLLGAGGTLSQIGFPHLRLRHGFDELLAAAVLPFVRAAAVKRRLRGRTFGLFGGRSLGIDTGTFDPLQWKRLFGVDTEHIDQLEIIRRADHVPAVDVDRMQRWLTGSVGRVSYNDTTFTPEKLAFQIRCYLATRAISAEMGLDFIAVKCMPDLTTHFVPQCISAALLPAPFDADGHRAPLMMACEADGDAALTMEILKEISGGMPVLFMDVSYIDDQRQTYYFPNCGALCAWYAARGDDPAANLRRIELRPANRPGGGAITYFTTAPGPLTLARLYRVDGHYRLAIVNGATVDIGDAEYDAFSAARGAHPLPTAFLKLDAVPDDLIATLGSNHILGVAGDHVRALEAFASLMEIEAVTFTVSAETAGPRPRRDR